MSTPVYWLHRHRLTSFDEQAGEWTTACGLVIADDRTEPGVTAPHDACGRCMVAEARSALAAATRPPFFGGTR